MEEISSECLALELQAHNHSQLHNLWITDLEGTCLVLAYQPQLNLHNLNPQLRLIVDSREVISWDSASLQDLQTQVLQCSLQPKLVLTSALALLNLKQFKHLNLNLKIIILVSTSWDLNQLQSNL